MERFDLESVLEQHPLDEGEYTEFLDKGSMSVGLYTIPAGGIDTQTPHFEDEIYYVLSGKATLTVEDETCSVRPTDLIFVEREAEHRFVDVEEDLELLVVFAPARGTLDSNG